MRYDLLRLSAHLEIPLGDPARFGEKRDFISDIFGGGSQSAPPAPDYGPMAAASKESAEIMAAQADRVLDESKRQYDKNLEVSKPVADAQLALMNQSKQQGDEYYSYWKTKAQPVEDALNAEAMAAGSEQKQTEAVDRAVADSQGGFTRSINQVMRQGKRYGMSPAAVSDAGGAMAVTQAANTAAAATGAREREKTLGYAKKLDVAGLYRGMPSASQGAYSVATTAGNSAVGNTRAVGQDMVAGTAAAAGLAGQGQQMRMGGLGAILNSQTSAYNQGLSHANDAIGGLGSLMGGAASLYTAFSSKKLKTNRRPVDAEVITKGLQRVPVEAWRYKDGVADGGDHVGPYAEDVQREFGDSAAPGGNTIDLVSMNGIALAVGKNNADRLDRIESKLGMQRRG